ncbi:MAG: hypothetical protein ABI772_13370, partial [Bacteroidota bacterium]
MKSSFIFFFILIVSFFCKAQVNLVPNPSFEIYDTCPDYAASIPAYYNAIYWAIPWTQPYTPENSTDFFHSCDISVNLLGTPYNYEGFQPTHTGSGYAGLIAFQLNYREYLETELLDSLIQGKKYCVSFYVSFANMARIACDGIQAYLSDTFVHYDDPQFGLLSLPAQVQNPSGNVITDTLNWVLISDTLTALGGEKFITIGNYKDDIQTNILQN